MTGELMLPAAAPNTSVAILDQLAEIPEEEIWLAKQKSARTRRAYRLDVHHFMATLGITTTEQLRQADHRAVIAWERMMRETERAALAALPPGIGDWLVLGNRSSVARGPGGVAPQPKSAHVPLMFWGWCRSST